ncbi:MAG TPA: inorganic diphosphatase [Vicinamibacterales bacterium]|nr:inorganic diphosphatase [Vicinamibacterales bacterium]
MRIALLFLLLLAQSQGPPAVLPPAASAQLTASLTASRLHARHVWRDTAPFDRAGRVTAFIEIPRGSRRKFEFDMGANRLRLDRVMPPGLAYPVNYGFVPQTVSYDGDPFDVLVLGPALETGTILPGVMLGIMHMTDEKGLDSKVVVSPLDAAGKPRFTLTSAERERIGTFFQRYKRHEPGKFSRVTGWGPIDEGAAFVQRTHAFFTAAGGPAGSRK